MRRTVRQNTGGAKDARFRWWALWLIDRFKPDGSLIATVDRRWILAESGISARGFSNYMRRLEELGVIERRHEGRLVGGTEYRHVLVIRCHSRFRWQSPQQAAELARERLRRREQAQRDAEQAYLQQQRAEQAKGTVCYPTPHKGSTESTVVALVGTTTGPRAFDLEVPREDRTAILASWPGLYRSRSSIPDLRPCAEPWSAQNITCAICGQRGHTGGMCTAGFVISDDPVF
jgi:hypothetical protein